MILVGICNTYMYFCWFDYLSFVSSSAEAKLVSAGMTLPMYNIISMVTSPQMDQDSWECVPIYVREKKKWKKYPCAIRGNNFIQFKDLRVRRDT